MALKLIRPLKNKFRRTSLHPSALSLMIRVGYMTFLSGLILVRRFIVHLSFEVDIHRWRGDDCM